MNTERIKIIGSERKLSEGELEKAIFLIESLPPNTFMSREEGNKKGANTPIYMEASELKIEYSPDANILNISSRRTNSERSIGSIFYSNQCICINLA